MKLNKNVYFIFLVIYLIILSVFYDVYGYFLSIVPWPYSLIEIERSTSFEQITFYIRVLLAFITFFLLIKVKVITNKIYQIIIDILLIIILLDNILSIIFYLIYLIIALINI